VSPRERAFRARIAAHMMHSLHDAREITRSARRAFLDRFEREVDPDDALSPKERALRADHARRSYFSALALRSAQARRRRKT
jgi:hypothetical protein